MVWESAKYKVITKNNSPVGESNWTQLPRLLITNTGFEINACLRQAEIASGKLFFSLTCSTDKLTKYSASNNFKQDYLEAQLRSSFIAIK